MEVIDRPYLRAANCSGCTRPVGEIDGDGGIGVIGAAAKLSVAVFRRLAPAQTQPATQSGCPKSIEHQQLGIAGHDHIGFAVHGQFQKLVILGITAQRDTLGDRFSAVRRLASKLDIGADTLPDWQAIRASGSSPLSRPLSCSLLRHRIRLATDNREPATVADQSSDQHIHGYCALCIARCGTVAVGRRWPLHPPGTRSHRIRPGQAICAKGRAAPELVYHPERLTHPLRRTRPKGDADPGWERIGWDEALDLTGVGDAPASRSSMAPRRSPSACPRLHHRDRRFQRLHPAADERLRHAERGVQPRHLRLGPRLRHPLHLWRRQRRHQRRRRHAGHRQHRLPDPVGLQPQLLPPYPRDRGRRRR